VAGAALALGVSAVALATYILVVSGLAEPPFPGLIPAASLVVLFAAAEAFVQKTRGHAELAGLSAHDAGVVFGLFLLTANELLTVQLGGAALALTTLLLLHRMPVTSVWLRLATLALGTCLALAVFHALLDVMGRDGPGRWLAAFAAAIVATAAPVAVDTAAARLGGGDALAGVGRRCALALAGAVSGTSMAVAAVELTEVGRPEPAVLLLVPFVAGAVAIRAYASERRRLESLRTLYDSMLTVHAAGGHEAGVRELLGVTREVMGVEAAWLVLPGRHTGDRALVATVSSTGETLLTARALSSEEHRVVEILTRAAAPLVLPAGESHEALLAALGLEEGIGAALRGDTGVIGVVVVGNSTARSGRSVSRDDVDVLESLAGHAAVLLENDRLERSLTELTTLKEQLRHQAFHDALTGLPNRALFAERVEHALARNAAGTAVLFLDLDDFKMINDSFGHHAGDELLVTVARRVEHAVREHDLPARLGGDEFAVLATGTSRADVEAIADRLVRALEQPFLVGGRDVSVHASVGIAYGADGVSHADDLLRNADVAMYDAKQGGKRRFAVYEERMHEQVRRRQEVAAALERAVERGEIGVHFQPIVDLEDGRVVSVEALARWNGRSDETRHPSTFIPLADEIGLMVPIGRAVLRESCRQARSWQVAFPGHGSLTVNVNLAPSELHDPQVAGDVERILDETGLSPDRLVLEITETGVMRNPDTALRTMDQLRALGVSLALDDFGTGHSSLAYLREFPLDTLKIARPFLAGLPGGHVDEVFVEAIVRLARSLGLQVVAEGIETAGQAEAVMSLGCGLGQGFFFGQPLSQLGVATYLGALSLPVDQRAVSAA
jgi:diguanylate cyclase (GGDEF)-like protein